MKETNSDIKIILASKSPRRLELLNMLGYDVKTVVSEVDESLIYDNNPSELARKLSYEKAMAVYSSLTDDSLPIIAADTLVDLNGTVLGKPKDRDDAKNMLTSLSGSTHFVHTGFTVLYKGNVISECNSSSVIFRKISDFELNEYLTSMEYADKAGAYGIQGKAGAFVEKIDGDFFSIMGLPICAIAKIINELTEGNNESFRVKVEK